MDESKEKKQQRGSGVADAIGRSPCEESCKFSTELSLERDAQPASWLGDIGRR